MIPLSCLPPTDCHPEFRYFVQSVGYQSEVVRCFERYFLASVITWVSGCAIYSVSPHVYLTHLVIALLGLLEILLVRGV